MNRFAEHWKRVARGAALTGTAFALGGCASVTAGGGTVASTHAETSRPVFPPSSGVSITTPAAPSSDAPTGQPTTPAAPAAVPPAFVGDWYGHGRTLTVHTTGGVDVTFRTYVNCTPTVTIGCDRVIGNEIHDGGLATATVTRVDNATTIELNVSSSTVPSAIPLGPVRMGLDTGHDAVALFAGQFSGLAFCGPRAPSGYCGA